jgi:hypothetical protein
METLKRGLRLFAISIRCSGLSFVAPLETYVAEDDKGKTPEGLASVTPIGESYRCGTATSFWFARIVFWFARIVF